MRYFLGFLFPIFILFILPHAAVASSNEEAVRAFFKDIPVMIEIARCESKLNQFDAAGLPLRGGWNGGMVGVFQIYESVHTGTAASMGFDLSTLEGNMEYAKHLYLTQGTTPWNSGKSCWQSVAETNTEELERRIELLQEIVGKLRQLLALKSA